MYAQVKISGNFLHTNIGVKSLITNHFLKTTDSQ